MSSKKIQGLEVEQDAVLQKIEANLKTQLNLIDTEIQALCHKGAPKSMWAFAHWDHERGRLEEGREAVLEKRRFNLEEQRGALDRIMTRRRTEAKKLHGGLRRGHEVGFKALGVRRGELMRELADVRQVSAR